MNADTPLREALRQMLALLEGERQALAALDLARIMTCADGKTELCSRIEARAEGGVDEESRGLLDAVVRLNEINRKLRNLIAANVESRLSALSGRVGVYAGVGRSPVVREMPR